MSPRLARALFTGTFDGDWGRAMILMAPSIAISCIQQGMSAARAPIDGPSRRNWRFKLVVTAGVVSALVTSALVGGIFAVSVLTGVLRGDLTSATLAVSIANEAFGDANCELLSPDSEVRNWNCRVFISDESGNTASVDYDVVADRDDCWTATQRGKMVDGYGSAPPARLDACIHALQSADNHSLLD